MSSADEPGGPDAADGDFERLFDEHYVAVRRYLSRRIGEHTAEDLAAETFLTSYRERHRFDAAAGSPRSWLFGIAKNLLRHQVRHETRGYHAVANARMRPEAVDPHDAPVARQVDAECSVRSLASVLATLPPRDRDVLLLSSWAGLNNVEIAAALQIPVGTVGSRLHRVRERVRTEAEGARGGEPVVREDRSGGAAAVDRDPPGEGRSVPRRHAGREGRAGLVAGPHPGLPRRAAARPAGALRPPRPRRAGQLPRLRRAAGLRGDLLRTGLAPADLRAALYRALKLVPGLEVTDEAANLDGRVGTALGIDDPSGDRDEIVIDARTGAFIGERRLGEDGVVLGFTAVTTAGADELGVVPTG